MDRRITWFSKFRMFHRDGRLTAFGKMAASFSGVLMELLCLWLFGIDLQLAPLAALLFLGVALSVMCACIYMEAWEVGRTIRGIFYAFHLREEHVY